MTYQFVDTVRQTEMVGESMPDEAVRINGKWLENEVSGYRTLHVSGRELISTEINTNTIAGMNGEIFLNSRIPARVIAVRYLLAAKSNFEFRQAFNQLCRLLQPAQVEVVFADEPDKYFIGTKSEIENPEPGSNITTGEFKIYCTDPFKYSTTEKTFQMDSTGTIMVENTGSVPVPIRYEITHNHENGYVGIASEHGAMEFGKREEADGQTYQQMEHLLSISDFVSASDDTTSKDAMHPTYGTKGTLTTKSWAGRTYLTLGTV